MPRVTPIINTFAAGELSPFLDGRTDIQAYYNGAKTVENFFILPYGCLMRRPGTYYVAEVKDSDDKTRIIPFSFSTTQSYIIEIGDAYMRFYKDQGQIASGGSPYEITSPYAIADVFDLQFAQEADTMYIVHPSYKPQKLTRTGHTAWTIGDYEPTTDPFTSADNYPSCVAIYEKRLCFANTNTNPQTVWATVADDYEDMTTGPNDGDALEYTIGSVQMNAIKWLCPGKLLLLGTLGGIFSISSGSDEPLTPTNVVAKRETSFGSIGIIPQKIGNLVTFVDSSGKILREIGYSYEADEYQANDVTILSEHITGADGITDMDYQRSPYNMLWCVRSDGQIATMTRQLEQQIRGWTRQKTGWYVAGEERGLFESIAVIPGDDEDDEVWFIVKRYIDSGWVRYVEYLKPTYFTDQEDAYFVDCGLSLNTAVNISNIQWSDDIVAEGNIVAFTETIPAQTITVSTEVA